MTKQKKTVTLNIPYIYFMQILPKYALLIRKQFLYLIALLLSAVVVIQVTRGSGMVELREIIRTSVFFLSNYIVWVFLIEYLYGAMLLFRTQDKSWILRISEMLISFTLLIGIHLLVTNLIYYSFVLVSTELLVEDIWADFQPFLLKSILSRIMDVIMIAIFIRLMEGYLTIQKQKIQLTSLQDQLHVSQLEALRAQLDPHFLFNTLHTLHALIGYDNRKAKSMLIKVTDLMRKTLDQRGKHLIPLEEELKYIQNYLEIEQERFHDRLNVVLTIAENTKKIQVPALILQPLIENAFKHGISLMSSSGVIHVSANLENNTLILTIKNSIPNTEVSSRIPSGKLGLMNVKMRLDQVYGNHYEFSTNSDKDFFTVQLAIQIKNEV
jgi:sensor histidine kinase YesM